MQSGPTRTERFVPLGSIGGIWASLRGNRADCVRSAKPRCCDFVNEPDFQDEQGKSVSVAQIHADPSFELAEIGGADVAGAGFAQAKTLRPNTLRTEVVMKRISCIGQLALMGIVVTMLSLTFGVAAAWAETPAWLCVPKTAGQAATSGGTSSERDMRSGNDQGRREHPFAHEVCGVGDRQQAYDQV